MSDANMSDGTFNRLFTLMIIAMAVLTVILMVLAVQVSIDVTEKLTVQSKAENSDNIAKRIAPVGQISTSTNDIVEPTTQIVELSGDEVYATNCAACHDSGAAGAPKIADISSWSSRLAKGKEM